MQQQKLPFNKNHKAKTYSTYQLHLGLLDPKCYIKDVQEPVFVQNRNVSCHSIQYSLDIYTDKIILQVMSECVDLDNGYQWE